MGNAAIAAMVFGLGPVSMRRMFGGTGIDHRGRIVAIEWRGEVLPKADPVSAPQVEAGARRWAREGRNGKTAAVPYGSIPEEAFDDPDVMARWMRLADAAALHAASA